MSVNGKTRESNAVESTIFRFLSRLGAAAYYCKKPGPSFYIGDFREFLRRCFGRMTISGSGILSIVNCFLASLGPAQFFLRFVPADRPRSICSRDCPSIISLTNRFERVPWLPDASIFGQSNTRPVRSRLQIFFFLIRLRTARRSLENVKKLGHAILFLRIWIVRWLKRQ